MSAARILGYGRNELAAIKRQNAMVREANAMYAQVKRFANAAIANPDFCSPERRAELLRIVAAVEDVTGNSGSDAAHFAYADHVALNRQVNEGSAA